MKHLLLIILTALIFKNSDGQVSGFKISTGVSTIPAYAPTEQKFLVDQNKKINYETLDIVNLNNLGKVRRQDSAILKKLIDSLYNNSLGDQPTINPADFKLLSDSIKKLQAEIVEIKSQQDSLYYLYTKDFLSFRKSMVLNFGPLRSKAFFDIVYGNSGKTFRALGNAGLNFGNKSTSLYSEIVSGNLGLFKVSLGTMVSKSYSQDSAAAQNEEAYQRLVSNGGNTVLNFEYPLMYLHSYNNQYNFISTFNAKGAADLPAIGTDTSKWAGSGSFGINFYGEASTSKNELSFFANFNMNMIYGTDVFKENLGISKTHFTFGQFSAGLVFLNNFKISFIIATISSEKNLRNKSVVIGGQVLK